MFQKITVAVVGCGSVGISFIAQLIEGAIKANVADNLEILLFEPQKSAGPGYAYQEDFECNLLNTSADSMSAISGDKQHFLKWLVNKGTSHTADFPRTKIDVDDFLPRSLFGRYLNDLFNDATQKALSYGIVFNQIYDSVIDVVQLNNGQLCVDTGDGAYLVDQLIVSMGNQPANNFPHLESNTKFFNNPYPTQEMARRVPKKALVCVLGTGLSAIDSVLSLVEAGHEGSIVMASRSGRLPSVRGIYNKPHALQHLTRAKLDALAEHTGNISLTDVYFMLRSEIEAATGEPCDVSEIMNADTGVFDYLSSEIQQSEKQERLWQSVVYATNSIIDYVWHLLSNDDKRLFQSTFGRLWHFYRVSFPLKNALKLSELLRKDRVLVQGGVTSCRFNEITNAFEIRIHDMRKGFRSLVESDYLINATGYSTAVAKLNEPFIKNMLRRKIASYCEFGGFELDFDTGHLVQPDGKINPSISVLGSLAVGTYFWTNAMDVNARLAKQQAENVIKLIDNQKYRTRMPLFQGGAVLVSHFKNSEQVHQLIAR